MIETETSVASVPLTVIELKDGDVSGVEPGFYYTVYTENSDPTVPFCGPYADKQLALEAAKAFVEDCLTDYREGLNVSAN